MSLGTTTADGSGKWSFTSGTLSDGNHSITAKATDAADNTSSASTAVSVTIDTAAPSAPSITSPANNSYDTDGAFTVSGTAEANSSVELFEGTQSKGTTTANGSGNWSINLSSVSEGDHTYTAKATDAAGNESGSSNSVKVTVDTTAPITTIDSGPSGTTNDNAPSFEFSSNETGSTFKCSLDGASYGECSSGDSFGPLGDGEHTFYVRATDAAGNTSNAASRTFTVDTTAPNTTIDSGPSGTTNSTTATFEFSSSEPRSTFECKLDSGSFASCVSPKTYSSLSEGSHTFQVRATDVAGHTDSTPDNRTFTVDTTAPSAPDITSPANNSYDNDGAFTVSGVAEANSTIKLYEGSSTTPVGTTTANNSGTWSIQLIGVAEGSHTYTAKATDAAGNTSNASNARTVIVDTTAPDTTISSGPSGTVNSRSARFEFSSESGATFECGLDGAPFSSCTSPKDYTDLSDGEHTFWVQAKDAAGNTDSSPASRTWTIDATAPTVNTVAPAENATGVAADTNVEATFSESMKADTLTISTFKLVKQGTTTPVQASVTYDATAKKATLNPNADLDQDATYTATIKGGSSGVKDAAGNPLASDKVWSFTTGTPPKVSSVSPADNTTGVKLSTSVKAVFSKAIDKATLTTSTFRLAPVDASGNVGQPIAATVTLSSNGKTATLNPFGSTSANLIKCTWYEATVTADVKDKAGNSLGQDLNTLGNQPKTWRFKTSGC